MISVLRHSDKSITFQRIMIMKAGSCGTCAAYQGSCAFGCETTVGYRYGIGGTNRKACSMWVREGGEVLIGKIVNDQVRDEIVERRRAGMGVMQIARELKVKRTIVTRVVREWIAGGV
jgi:hypothetical protein